MAKISDIKPNADNPRVIKDFKFKKMVKSIQDFPEMLSIRPIVVNESWTVLGGNMRLRACIEAGLKEVPIIEVNSFTPEQEREFIIKDNASFGEWDWDVLANQWEQTELVEWGIDSFNFGTSASPITFESDGEVSELNSPMSSGSQTQASPKITDTGYVRFELVLLEEHKKVVLDVLNQIQSKQESSLGEALYIMAESYIRNN